MKKYNITIGLLLLFTLTSCGSLFQKDLNEKDSSKIIELGNTNSNVDLGTTENLKELSPAEKEKAIIKKKAVELKKIIEKEKEGKAKVQVMMSGTLSKITANLTSTGSKEVTIGKDTNKIGQDLYNLELNKDLLTPKQQEELKVASKKYNKIIVSDIDKNKDLTRIQKIKIKRLIKGNIPLQKQYISFSQDIKTTKQRTESIKKGLSTAKGIQRLEKDLLRFSKKDVVSLLEKKADPKNNSYLIKSPLENTIKNIDFQKVIKKIKENEGKYKKAIEKQKIISSVKITNIYNAYIKDKKVEVKVDKKISKNGLYLVINPYYTYDGSKYDIASLIIASTYVKNNPQEKKLTTFSQNNIQFISDRSIRVLKAYKQTISDLQSQPQKVVDQIKILYANHIKISEAQTNEDYIADMLMNYINSI